VKSKETERVLKEFSGDWDVMRLLMHESKLCTLWELEEKYTLDQFYDMLEMIDVQDALRDDSMRNVPENNKQQKGQK